MEEIKMPEVDSNMNAIQNSDKNQNGGAPVVDIEAGSGAATDSSVARRSVSRVPWRRVVVMVATLGVVVALAAVLWVYLGWTAALQLLALVLVLYVIAFKWHWCYIAIKTAPRDLKALYCYIKILWLTRQLTKKNWTIADVFHDTVRKYPNKTCFLFQDEAWTFSQVEEFSLRVTAVLRAHGYGPGKTVAVLMSNCPQYPATWLGISRLGAVAPLINTQQQGKALLHSINVAKCDAVIYSDEFHSVLQEIANDLSPSMALYKFTARPLRAGASAAREGAPAEAGAAREGAAPAGAGAGAGAAGDCDGVKDFTSLLESTPPAPWALADGDGFQGKLLYIYTSGTTGLPKAAVISHSRFVFMVSGIHYLGGLRHSDVVYCPLPLYHTAGGIMTTGQALLFGCTVVYKTKFSASQYFPDCIKYKATVAHYIGEMCRYVLATPPAPTDTQHRVRIVYGNGMRPQIWGDFVKRFNIKRVAEFYGATEGNANIVNIDGKEGAIGFVSRIIPWVYPIAIIRADQDSGEPIRDSRGLCQLARPGELGVFIGKINPNNPSRAFLGYVDKSASEKKIVRDVFKHGDSAFISGDLLMADAEGYLYFRDRTGDTYRWRGENVSTSEVEAAVSRVVDQRDAVVFGVLIPGTEGRAGMAGIVDTNGTLKIDTLAQDLAKDLPAYARPIFVRVMTSVDMTGTFKMKKKDLQEQGYNPSVVADQLYYLDAKLARYVPLGEREYAAIVAGHIRL